MFPSVLLVSNVVRNVMIKTKDNFVSWNSITFIQRPSRK